jgi:UDP-N-acetylglucosamine diphosphorylase / glucose-1-phosphate thymidylyltransferase / UDP-N-acetylgalactosamine diphosphorylase / glucosamine-1-phosphate N-acetyltransferase / galactosamine-1-phosphate N-acetyltransferase
MENVMKAIILAAGEGKRLRPFTETMPKVMLPVANKPILEHVFDALKKAGIVEIILVVGYKKEVIMDYFKDYKNIKITYVTQEKQLGTAHALLQAKNIVSESFIVIPGDNIIDYKSIQKLIHDKSEYSVLIKEHPHPSKYGVVFLEKQELKKLVEKPKEETGRFISTGIYKLPKTVFKEIEELSKQGIYDLSSMVQLLLKEEIAIQTIIADFWMDIVYPWDLININEKMIQKIKGLTAGTIEKNVTIKGNVKIGSDTKIYSGSYIVGPVVIGKGCEIGPNVCIFPSTSIGDNAVIHPGAEIQNSVIMNDTHIGSSSFIINSVVARGSILGHNFSSSSGENTIEVEGEYKKVKNLGCLIGEDCTIQNHVVVDPGVVIGRKCNIESMKRIRKNIQSNSKVM